MEWEIISNAFDRSQKTYLMSLVINSVVCVLTKFMKSKVGGEVRAKPELIIC